MTQHLLFPVTLSGQWHSTASHPHSDSLPKSLLDWLLDEKSLTARLKRQGNNFRVELLGQQVEACHEDEANDVINVGEQVLVREVLLYCGNTPQVFARSLLPLSSLTGDEQKLATLGTQSLGQVLFNNPSLVRQNIEISSFDDSSSVAKLSAHLGLVVDSTLWGRRSIFMLENKPLMVAEVFLPQAFAYPCVAVENENVK